MATFSFLHAADLHLDSPLIGLSWKSAEFAEKVENASRQALDALVDLAIEEECRFVLLAGDVFDGEVKNFSAALNFMGAMRRLDEKGIKVFVVLGNHDSANRFATKKLEFAGNVHVFGKARAKSVNVDDLDVVVHGRSFPSPDFNENMALDYPAPVVGKFNIGVLHTACDGREGEHARYAPCTVEQLVNHGYDYWALGHVHSHMILNEAPHIVYSGNLQGRDPRETGAKGAVLVTVENGAVLSVEHRPLDAVRWAVVTAKIGGHLDRTEAIATVRESLQLACEDVGERPMALRLILRGETSLHDEFRLESVSLREDVETVIETLGRELWLEKLLIETERPRIAEVVDPTVAGRLESEVRKIADDGPLAKELEKILNDVRAKLPGGRRAEEFLERMKNEIPARAASLARALLSEAGHAAD